MQDFARFVYSAAFGTAIGFIAHGIGASRSVEVAAIFAAVLVGRALAATEGL